MNFISDKLFFIFNKNSSLFSDNVILKKFVCLQRCTSSLTFDVVVFSLLNLVFDKHFFPLKNKARLAHKRQIALDTLYSFKVDPTITNIFLKICLFIFSLTVNNHVLFVSFTDVHFDCFLTS